MRPTTAAIRWRVLVHTLRGPHTEDVDATTALEAEGLVLARLREQGVDTTYLRPDVTPLPAHAAPRSRSGGAGRTFLATVLLLLGVALVGVGAETHAPLWFIPGLCALALVVPVAVSAAVEARST